MNYVKHFSICGVDTRQVACIELHGKPNAATEGSLGVLGIDVDSPLHEVYKCVAVNGSIYTWELLSSGMSILAATISGNESKSATFPYANLRIPSGYVVKAGDLILDSESYLYQVKAITSGSCVAEYINTQICVKYMESPQYSTGLEFSSNGDGTCKVGGIGTCTDTNVIIPRRSPDGDIVTSIKNYAFYRCESFTSIVIPDSVTSIEHNAFLECKSFMQVVIPNSVTSIGNYAFSNCGGLTSIVIPNSVTSIGNYAFSGCDSLKSVVISGGVTSIGGNSVFASCTNLKSVVIPDSVTSIGKSLFVNCRSLTSIVIPNSVTSIGDDVFRQCSNLTIYAEAPSKPDGWDDNWNPDNRPVVWGAAIDIPTINDKLATAGGTDDSALKKPSMATIVASDLSPQDSGNYGLHYAVNDIFAGEPSGLYMLEFLDSNYTASAVSFIQYQGDYVRSCGSDICGIVPCIFMDYDENRGIILKLSDHYSFSLGEDALLYIYKLS